MTVEVKDKRQLERVVSALRRISGVRDIERVNPMTVPAPRTANTSPFPNPRESRSTGRTATTANIRSAYLRDECPCASCTGAHGTEPQKTNYSAAPASPFPMYKPTQDAERRSSGRLRHAHRLERRPQHRDLFVRLPAPHLPVPGVPIADRAGMSLPVLTGACLWWGGRPRPRATPWSPIQRLTIDIRPLP